MRFASCLLFVLMIVGLSGCSQCDRCQSPFFGRIRSSGIFQRNSLDCCNEYGGRRLGSRLAARSSETLDASYQLIDDSEAPPTPPMDPAESTLEAPVQKDAEPDNSNRQDDAEVIEQIVDPNEGNDTGLIPPVRTKEPEVHDFESQDDFYLSVEQPTEQSNEQPTEQSNEQPNKQPNELQWKSQAESGFSILEDGWDGVSDVDLDTNPENQVDLQPKSGDNAQRRQIKALPASTSKSVVEPENLDEIAPAPFDAEDETEEVGPDLQQLPAAQEEPSLPIVLKARPVESHVVNDGQIKQSDSLPQHTSVADASLFIPCQLRPKKPIKFEDLPILEETQSEQPLEFPCEESEDRTSENQTPRPLNEEPQNDPLTTATSYDAPFNDIVIRARPAIDASTKHSHQARARIAQQLNQGTAILRLRAVTPPDQNATYPPIASFDMRAPIIVRAYHPDVVPPKTKIESQNVQQAVRPVLKAKTQLKTIER